MRTNKKILLITIVFLLMCNLTPFFTTAQVVVNIDTFMFKPGYYDDLNKAIQEPDKVLYLDLSMIKLTSLPPEIGSFKNIIESERSKKIIRLGRQRELPLCKGCN